MEFGSRMSLFLEQSSVSFPVRLSHRKDWVEFRKDWVDFRKDCVDFG
jgi:hypothetical protein